MSTMLSDFLNEQGITPEDVVNASKNRERRSSAHRTLAVSRETARRQKKSYEESKLEKPARYGRGFSSATLHRALAGQALPRVTRQKIVRAVNEALTSKKKDTVEWRQLFSDVLQSKGGGEEASE